MKSEYSYYPFYQYGSLQPGRNFNAGDYRFGFNGKENDNEVKGTGNSLDFGARIYDPRLGRWMSVDPYFKYYTSLSPYNYAANNPIKLIDRDGKKIYISFTSQDAHDAFLDVMKMGLEGQFDVQLKPVGNGQYEVEIGTSSKYKGDVSKMTSNGKAFYQVMNKLTTDERSASVTAVYGDEDVDVGKFETGQIDMSDIKKFNMTGPFKVTLDGKTYTGVLKSRGFTRIGKLAHEFYEQFQKQAYGQNNTNSHKSAIINAENPVNNNERSGESYSRGSYTQTAIEKDGTKTKMTYNVGSEPFEVDQPVSTPEIKSVK